jgi:accessory colonization factor AcfC
MRNAVHSLTIVAVVLSGAGVFAAESDSAGFWTTPTIQGFGKIHELPDTAYKPDRASTYKIAFALTKGSKAPLKAAPKAFGALHQVEVDVTARPADTRTAGLKSNGDPIYSGSEATMSDFVNQFGSRMETSSIEPLYLQSAAILVRPGNLMHMSVFQDLLNADRTVMVVHGAPTVHAFVAILHGPERYEK